MTAPTLDRPAAVATPDETFIPPMAAPAPLPADAGHVAQKGLVIVAWSGEYDRIMPTLILASTAAASGVPTKVFITFWGLLPFVKDEHRITGEGWMQKMLALMQRPGIHHLKLSKMQFAGMGPWMIGKLSEEHHVAKPAELLEACQALGVELIPCQMTMDMFGLRRDQMVDGIGEPAGAATVIELMTQPGTASLFI